MADPVPLLVGIDHSPGSVLALARARHLADETSAPLVLCSVLPDTASSAEVEAVRSQLDDVSDGQSTRVRQGVPFIELIEEARNVGAALIIVGATGEHTDGQKALGVTVDRLTRKADRPVLVVRRHSENGYRSVLVGLDGSSDAIAAANLARELAPRAEITGVLAASTVGEEWLKGRRFDEEDVAFYRHRIEELAREKLSEVAASLPIDMQRVLLGRPQAVLVEATIDHNADLVAVGRRGVSPLASVLLGSVGHHLVHEAPCDVLVHRSPDPDFRLP